MTDALIEILADQLEPYARDRAEALAVADWLGTPAGYAAFKKHWSSRG